MKKFKFSLPSVYTTLFIFTILVALLTHVVPVGKFQYQGNETGTVYSSVNAALKMEDGSIDGEKVTPIPNTFENLEAVTDNEELSDKIANAPQGFLDVSQAWVKAFAGASDIALFILVIGGFLNVTLRSGALDASLNALTKAFHGREFLLLPILIIIMAIMGSTYGAAEETVAFWAILIPVLTRAGYDRMVVAGIILLGAGVGVLASTVNPFATAVASEFAEIALGDGIGLRFLLLCIFTILATVYIMIYASKIKKDPSKSVLFDVEFKDKLSSQASEVEFTFKRKIIIAIFSGTFGIMIFGVIPFEDMGILSVPTLWWWFNEITTLFFLATILIGIIDGVKEQEFVSTFLEGSKDMLGVALVIAVARGIGVIMADGMITDSILNWASDLAQNFSTGAFAVVTYIVHIVLALFVPSTSGLATLSMPIMAPLGDTQEVSRALVITAYQSGAGLINLFAPTAGHLIAGLTLAGIPYGRYVRWVAPFLVVIFVINAIILFIAAS